MEECIAGNSKPKSFSTVPLLQSECINVMPNINNLTCGGQSSAASSSSATIRHIINTSMISNITIPFRNEATQTYNDPLDTRVNLSQAVSAGSKPFEANDNLKGQKSVKFECAEQMDNNNVVVNPHLRRSGAEGQGKATASEGGNSLIGSNIIHSQRVLSFMCISDNTAAQRHSVKFAGLQCHYSNSIRNINDLSEVFEPSANFYTLGNIWNSRFCRNGTGPVNLELFKQSKPHATLIDAACAPNTVLWLMLDNWFTYAPGEIPRGERDRRLSTLNRIYSTWREAQAHNSKGGGGTLVVGMEGARWPQVGFLSRNADWRNLHRRYVYSCGLPPSAGAVTGNRSQSRRSICTRYIFFTSNKHIRNVGCTCGHLGGAKSSSKCRLGDKPLIQFGDYLIKELCTYRGKWVNRQDAVRPYSVLQSVNLPHSIQSVNSVSHSHTSGLAYLLARCASEKPKSSMPAVQDALNLSRLKCPNVHINNSINNNNQNNNNRSARVPTSEEESQVLLTLPSSNGHALGDAVASSFIKE